MRGGVGDRADGWRRRRGAGGCDAWVRREGSRALGGEGREEAKGRAQPCVVIVAEVESFRLQIIEVTERGLALEI